MATISLNKWYRGEVVDDRIFNENNFIYQARNFNPRLLNAGVKGLMLGDVRTFLTRNFSDRILEMLPYSSNSYFGIGFSGGLTTIYEMTTTGFILQRAQVPTSAENYAGAAVVRNIGGSSTLYYVAQSSNLHSINTSTWSLNTSVGVVPVGNSRGLRGVHATDDLVYLPTENSVHVFDPATGTIHTYVYELPDDIVDIVEFGLFIIVLTHSYNRGSWLYVFDQKIVANDPVASVFVSGEQAFGLEALDDGVRILTRNNIYRFSGGNTVYLERSLGNVPQGYLYPTRGVDPTRIGHYTKGKVTAGNANNIYFYGDGGVRSYGRNIEGTDKVFFNVLNTEISHSEVDFVQSSVSGDEVIFATNDGTTQTLQVARLSSIPSTSSASGVIYTSVFDGGDASIPKKINSIKLTARHLRDATVSISYRTDGFERYRQTDPYFQFTLLRDLNFVSGTNKVTTKTFQVFEDANGNEPVFTEIQFKIDVSSPDYFELIDIEIDYEPLHADSDF